MFHSPWSKSQTPKSPLRVPTFYILQLAFNISGLAFNLQQLAFNFSHPTWLCLPRRSIIRNDTSLTQDSSIQNVSCTSSPHNGKLPRVESNSSFMYQSLMSHVSIPWRLTFWQDKTQKHGKSLSESQSKDNSRIYNTQIHSSRLQGIYQRKC